MTRNILENTYALIRVSTKKQKEARQITRMTKLGIPKSNIVIEKESGKSTVRTKYHKLVKSLKSGDTLYIENIDRLGRDYDSILREWHILKQRGIIIKVLDNPILDTDQNFKDLSKKFMRDIMLLTQAYEAESEWQKIKSRQAQGIVAAKASGTQFGRPKTKPTESEIEIVKQYQNRDISLDTALNLLNIKKSAFYKLCGTVKGL